MRLPLILIWAAMASGGSAKEASFDLKQVANGQEIRLVYLWHDDQLRIAESRQKADSASAAVVSPAPMNIYHLKKQELTLILPVNQSYEVLPLSALLRRPAEELEGMDARAISEGGTAAPPAAMMAEKSSEAAEWKATEETREFHGFKCRKWILPARRDQELVVWAAESKELPPFHFLVRGKPPRFGPEPDASETWPNLVREKNWFPFLVVLQNNGRQGQTELMRWEIEKFSTDPLTKEQKDTFIIPENYFLNSSANR